MNDTIKKILVIKLGALGDFIQALGPMAAIRRHHPDAHITLLTGAAFRDFGASCGYFNEIWIDEKPKWHEVKGWMKLGARLRGGNFTRVYDLQNNDRTAFYFRLLSPGTRPEWVGAVKGASHRNASRDRSAGHAFDGHVQTLAGAGITGIEIDRLEWMRGDLSSFDLRPPYILMVPGSAPDRKEKRWPAQSYAEIAKFYEQRGYQSVILGGNAERADKIAETILKSAPLALDLTGQTSFTQIAALARGAAGAIGNDTGPMHLIAATGCPSLCLFSKSSNPVRHAPKGEYVETIQSADLSDLAPEKVIGMFKPRDI
jgi:ADP-heptose:LPS heptosyltransferase